MTYREDFTLPAELLEQVQEQGLEILPELIRVILNTAMQAEREEHLNATSYQHTAERQGYANGYKPKTMRTRGGRDHVCRAASSGRRVLSAGSREGVAERTSPDAGFGRDVCARRLDSQGESHHGATVRHVGLIGHGEPGCRSDGRGTGEMAGPAIGRISVPLHGCLL